MALITDLPPELLRLIIQKLNNIGHLDFKGYSVIIRPDLDIATFSIAQVCRTWRDITFSLICNEDTSLWTSGKWRKMTKRWRQLEKYCKTDRATLPDLGSIAGPQPLAVCLMVERGWEYRTKLWVDPETRELHTLTVDIGHERLRQKWVKERIGVRDRLRDFLGSVRRRLW
ncbi:hypothetical protein PMZ80_007456 [Knufia obscura]|uniref:F-box domain-containing protein n=2 Tax=Knufia TaxID=430999 RepID=A0AAN8EBW9_9EURO|nr:hypothetical protein PMZ80_007456 [Knufia obscura]KAK5950455.1 hypothetical protein OHC33_008398 [Knufia fluminis]